MDWWWYRMIWPTVELLPLLSASEKIKWMSLLQLFSSVDNLLQWSCIVSKCKTVYWPHRRPFFLKAMCLIFLHSVVISSSVPPVGHILTTEHNFPIKFEMRRSLQLLAYCRVAWWDPAPSATHKRAEAAFQYLAARPRCHLRDDLFWQRRSWVQQHLNQWRRNCCQSLTSCLLGEGCGHSNTTPLPRWTRQRILPKGPEIDHWSLSSMGETLMDCQKIGVSVWLRL